jgi:hypothetical protein
MGLARFDRAILPLKIDHSKLLASYKVKLFLSIITHLQSHTINLILSGTLAGIELYKRIKGYLKPL